MQGANKTINTKVEFDLPMSKQVRQRQVTLNEGKTLVNIKGEYVSKFGNETYFLSCGYRCYQKWDRGLEFSCLKCNDYVTRVPIE